MSLLRSFPLMCFLLVLLSIVGVALAQQSVELLLVGGTLAVISWFVTEGPRGRALPRWVSNILIIGFSLHAFIQLFEHLGTSELVGVMGRFALWLSLIKLYERKSRRDYAHLLFMTLLMILSGCMRSAELFFGFVLFAYAVLGLHVLMLFQFHASFELARQDRAAVTPADYRLMPIVKPIVGRSASFHFRTLSALLSLVGLVLGAVVFTLYPRDLGRGMMARLDTPSLRRDSGFTSVVNLRTGGRINESRTLVATLDISNFYAEPVVVRQPIYLRGAVLERHSRRRGWSGFGLWERLERPSGRVIESDVGPSRMTPVTGRVLSARDIWTMKFSFVQPTNTIFSTYPPIGIRTGQNARVGFVADTQELLLLDGARQSSYSVQVVNNPSDSVLDELLSVGTMYSPRAGYRSDTVDQLARRLLEEAGVSAERPATIADRVRWNRDVAVVMRNYLLSSDFSYALDLSELRGSTSEAIDPLEQFLLHTKRGHCEFYAAGMVALCQSVGAQARLVSGYVVYDSNQKSGTYLILESNAHAWVEVRTGTYRWTTFDPTPPWIVRAMHDSSATLADQLRWMYERFEGDWNNSIVQYDIDNQSRLAGGWFDELTLLSARWTQHIKAFLARVNQAFYFGPAGYIWMVIVGFALFLAVLVLIRLAKRSRLIRRAAHLEHLRGREYQRLLRQLGFYIDMLRVLHRARLTKPSWQPPADFANSLRSRHPEAASLVANISEIFYKARYGHAKLTGEEMKAARERVGSLARLLGVRA